VTSMRAWMEALVSAKGSDLHLKVGSPPCMRVDGRLVVSRTRDGGKSFDVLSKGLPPAPGYDLVYRHGMDVTADGECLAMASTTGNLWISEDQGESWGALSLHLPPIAAVRFA